MSSIVCSIILISPEYQIQNLQWNVQDWGNFSLDYDDAYFLRIYRPTDKQTHLYS